MNLQDEVLLEFKKFYPGLTLAQQAEVTGIQVTRMFRLNNGSEMKLTEFEKFKTAIKSIQKKKNLFDWNEKLKGFCNEHKPLFEGWQRWGQYRSLGY
ncbi:MAG: hypothetical protein ACPGJV_01685 [Bacteriovoracaceae bacterium]